jgi:glutathione synthase/RimK-type ligase-like ATP-grasp enzyme
MSSEFIYRLKKRYPIFPGVREAVSAGFLADHYRRRHGERSAIERLGDIVVGLGFHAWIPLRARRVARKFGLDPSWAKRAARIAHQRFADPNDLALFRIEEPEDLDTYMRRFEYAAINKRINPKGWEADCALTDKLRFYQRCAAHGLPHPPVLATIEGGAIRVVKAPAQAALVLKPVAAQGGSGFSLIDYPGGPDPVSFESFLSKQHLRRRGRWLVQEKVANHQAFEGIAMNALATVRVTTIRNEAGAPEIVTSVLRFPSTAESPVDNIKAGGLMAPVDVEKGTLGSACQGRGVKEYERHPVSGQTIVGFQLPDWQEAKDLVQRAHRDVFPEYVMVGWDVALTPSGPMLIEGNGKPCMIVAQRANRRGIGSTRFGELIAHHLRQPASLA